MSAPLAEVMRLNVEVGLFGADWGNLDLLASYVARIVSVGRSDPVRYANMFSSVLNELLEVVYFHSDRAGVVECSIQRDGDIDRIALNVPCDPASRAFYATVRDSLTSDDSAQRYAEALLSDGPLDRRIGFWELVADYKATIAIAPTADAGVTVTVDLALDALEK